MDLREAARALLDQVDDGGPHHAHQEIADLRAALEAARPAHGGGEAVLDRRRLCDLLRGYGVGDAHDALLRIQRGDFDTPTPAATVAREAGAERSVVEAAVRAMRETALVHYNTPQEYDVACAQRAACEMAVLNALDAYLAHPTPAALEAAQSETEAPAGGCPDCDAKHPRYAVPSRGEVIHVLPGGQIILCEKAHHPTPAPLAGPERAVVGHSPLPWTARLDERGADILGATEPAGVPDPAHDIGIYGPRSRVVARVNGADDEGRANTRLILSLATSPVAPAAPDAAQLERVAKEERAAIVMYLRALCGQQSVLSESSAGLTQALASTIEGGCPALDRARGAIAAAKGGGA